MNEQVLDLLVEAALAIRLAGVQYRLYPLHGRPVIERTEEAITALERLFAERTSLTITSADGSLAFDGQEIERPEVALISHDYLRWMEAGCLQAIGFARGVQTNELARFLEVIATHEPAEGYLSLLSKIMTLNLSHIKILTWYFLQTGVVDSPEEMSGKHPVFSHQNIIEFLAKGAAMLPELAGGEGAGEPRNAMEESEAGLPSDTPLARADDFFVTSDNWPELPERLAASPPSVRSVLTANLAQWMRELHDAALLRQADELVCLRLSCENDLRVLGETVQLAEQRVNSLLADGAGEAALTYLQIVSTRYAEDTDPQMHRAMGELLVAVSAGAAYADWLHHIQIDTRSGVKFLHGLTGLLGEFAIHPLLEQLRKLAPTQLDARLLRLWSLLGEHKQGILIKELRGEHPWSYYCNLLQVLAAQGSAESLGAISEKCVHAHPLVRVQALTAAAAIARDQAAPYLAQP